MRMIRSTWPLARIPLVAACLFMYSSSDGFNNRYSASAFQPAVVLKRHHQQHWHHHVHPARSVSSKMWQGGAKRHRKSNVSKLFLLESHKDTMSSLTEESKQADRRSFLESSAKVCFFLTTIFVDPFDASAAPDTADSDEKADLTLRLFNPDGSLREGVESEAKFRTLPVEWASKQVASNQRLVNVNGVDQSPISSSIIATTDSSIQEEESAADIRVTYDLPDKWGSSGRSDLYLDRNDNNLKACNRITVYQAPSMTGAVDNRLLEKAATTGIAKALDVPSDIYSELKSADLIGGKTRIVNNGQEQQKYFDFDMAVAPSVCSDNGKENLGLGFCPFESIYLVSSTIVNGRVYAFVLECDKEQWKRANSDLRKVRSTFTVSTTV